jgi:hypothetical protein
MESLLHIAEFGLAGIASFTLALVLAKACLNGVLDRLQKDRSSLL